MEFNLSKDNNLEWLEYKGKKIFYINYSIANNEEEIILIDENATKQILESNNDKPVLIIWNMEKMKSFVTERTQQAYRNLRNATKNVKRCSVIITTDNKLKTVTKILSLFNKNLYFAQNLEDAKKWLVNQADRLGI